LISMKSTSPGRLPLPMINSLVHILASRLAYNARAKAGRDRLVYYLRVGELLCVGNSMEHVQKRVALTPQLKAQLPQPKGRRSHGLPHRSASSGSASLARISAASNVPAYSPAPGERCGKCNGR